VTASVIDKKLNQFTPMYKFHW